MKIRAMYIVMLVVAIGLLVYSAPAMATHASNTPLTHEQVNQIPGVPGPNDGHWDNWTVNDTDNLGLKGYLFIPGFLRIDCDASAVHGPPSVTDKNPAVGQAGCSDHAWDVLSAWVNGGFFDPRGGTNFIPPSGDHHRSGWRMLMRVPFSGGSWMSGFAPALGTFPNFNMAGLPGAGEAPDAVRIYCNADIEPFKDAELNPLVKDFDGDTNVDCDDVASLAAAAIMAFVDSHGEPTTPGRFPRYIPHERQGWPSTVVTKYTASSQNEGHGISQLLETSAKFLDGASGPTSWTWFSMSNENAEGCAGGWCEWFYDATTHTLCKRENAAAGVKSLSSECAGNPALEVTDADVRDIEGNTITHTLRKFEKAPVEIYQKLGQWVEMDTEGASAVFNGGFSHNVRAVGADDPGDGQAVWYEFWGMSGPNFQAEEAQDPLSWHICGASGDPAEEQCGTANAGGTGIDSNQGNPTAKHFWAVIDPGGAALGGLDPFARYGSDLRPTTGIGCTNTEAGGPNPGPDYDPAICGKLGAVVMCDTAHVGVDAYVDTDPGAGVYYVARSTCESNDGAVNGFGNDTGENIYYKEATENGLRGFVRESYSHAFSFINGIGVNHPNLCGALTGTGTFFDNDGDTIADDQAQTTECGDSPSTGTRQVMFQNITELGATISCFNCSTLGQHTVPGHGFETYSFIWTPLPGLTIPCHPTTAGEIPGESTCPP